MIVQYVIHKWKFSMIQPFDVTVTTALGFQNWQIDGPKSRTDDVIVTRGLSVAFIEPNSTPKRASNRSHGFQSIDFTLESRAFHFQKTWRWCRWPYFFGSLILSQYCITLEQMCHFMGNIQSRVLIRSFGWWLWMTRTKSCILWTITTFRSESIANSKNFPLFQSMFKIRVKYLESSCFLAHLSILCLIADHSSFGMCPAIKLNILLNSCALREW